ncbi:MAG: ArsA family ATPase [Spirochaetaceae bacterium]|nr:MAG: ArsA family ATPase [Spirochaetaceae bacterium]
MKSLFFTGKGGVGKSTLSAAAAWQLSEQGYKVLAVSFDPAHNLGDIYNVELGHKKKKFTKNLFLQEADLDTAASVYISQNIDILTEVYSYTRAFNLDLYFKVLRYSPGVEEYASLTVMEEIFRTETDFDYIVFDTPPTGLTLRILALPNITVTWIDRLRRIRKQILEKRYTIHNISGQYIEGGVRLAYEEKDDRVIQKLDELWKRYVGVYKTLKSDSTHICVVFNPDYLSLRESQRIVTGLKDLQLPLRVAYNNKFRDDLAPVADEVEQKLLNGAGDVELMRVPIHDYVREGAYKFAFDVTAPFR